MTNNDSFSVRMGIVPPKAMQVDDLDEDARIALYNAVDPLLPEHTAADDDAYFLSFYKELGTKLLKIKHDEIYDWKLIRLSGQSRAYGKKFYLKKDMKEKYRTAYNDKWYRVFEFIEFIHPIIESKEPLSHSINEALKQENVGFRFVDGKFISIISDEEIHAIEQAAASPFDNANNHLKKAIALLADRKNPDYANSIKESISAVESLATEITGGGSFDKAIAQLKKNGVPLHPQFAAAIKNMYHFTSDADGIRHGATGEPLQCNQATARYMLIICSAMVNFIAASKA